MVQKKVFLSVFLMITITISNIKEQVAALLSGVCIIYSVSKWGVEFFLLCSLKNKGWGCEG